MSRLLAWAFCLAAVVWTAGCKEQLQEPGAVTIAIEDGPVNLDPRIGTDASSERLSQLMFSSLVRRGDDSSIQPDLAERWEVPDPLTYIFHLRAGVTFHDGRPLSGKDVVYTLRSMLDGTIRTGKAGVYRFVNSVESPDPLTVVIKLKEPFGPLLWNLTRGAIGIVPQGSPADFSRNPIGSGAFRFVRYTQDEEVVLSRFDGYYGRRPEIATLRFRIIPEAIVRALELRKGSVDIGPNVLTPDMVNALKDKSDLETMLAPGTNYQYIAFNLRDPVFADLRVRQAIAYAIDREKIVKHLWSGQARLATGVIPPNNWAYEPNVSGYPYNPALARKLLAEAGQANLRFTYRTSTDETGRLLAAVLQQQLKEVGIDMEIRSNEFATMYADVLKGNFQMYSLRWIGGNNDPDIFNFVFHSSMTPPNGANRGFYSNPDVDRLIEIGRREADPEKRRKAYQEVQRIVSRDLPYVSLWYLDNACVFNKRIEGMKLHPDGNFDFLTDIRVRQ